MKRGEVSDEDEDTLSKSNIDKAVKYRLFYNKKHMKVLEESREKGEKWWGFR